jgi:nucleoside-diphosphate-sugar epimerase
VKVLLTGASSFTGSWFARELMDAGHEVVATFRRERDAYGDVLRRRRVDAVADGCRAIFGMSFGDPAFVALVRSERFDLLAHHGAEVTDYRSESFDANGALGSNTRGLPAVLEALVASGGRRVLLTGSVFEPGEGAGSEGLRAFSPYALSKALTAQTFQFHCERAGVGLGKFVIPNPFGPLEEPRYTAYLVRSWLAGEVARCRTPRYVRDNLHVSLLAKAYARFAERSPGVGFARTNPSGYVESQGDFTRRVARELRPRLGVACEVVLDEQKDFPEPRVRINTEPADVDGLAWSESRAWDDFAESYRRDRA